MVSSGPISKWSEGVRGSSAHCFPLLTVVLRIQLEKCRIDLLQLQLLLLHYFSAVGLSVWNRFLWRSLTLKYIYSDTWDAVVYGYFPYLATESSPVRIYLKSLRSDLGQVARQ